MVVCNWVVMHFRPKIKVGRFLMRLGPFPFQSLNGNIVGIK